MRGRGERVCVSVYTERERGEREGDVCNGFGSWSRRLAGMPRLGLCRSFFL
jgi:hypothetical protein